MISVTYIQHMGNDLTVVNAARVSFGKQREALGYTGVEGGAMRPILADGDVRLINYLAKHKHMSPFGHCFATFHINAPLFVARQLVKHKFLRWNEISRRYVDSEPKFYEPSEWRGRSEDKKQGSAGTVDIYMDQEMQWHRQLTAYTNLINNGVCPEQARMVLPQSMMTEWYWSGSLDAFADMCNLRTTDDTQYETRLAATLLSNKMLKLFPVSWYELLRDKRR